MRSGVGFDWGRRVMGGLLTLWLAGCGGAEAPELEPVAQAPGTGTAALAADAVDIREQLEAIPGLTVLSDTFVDGFRFFILDYDQPVDHRHPAGARFQQRMTLMHRDPAAPMVLDTEGTGLFTEPIPSEPADLLQGNQLAVEHRFFGTSRPARLDWSKLTIQQAAKDIHRVAQAFKPLYTGRWLSTGVFKGGTAALTHAYFFPNDTHAIVTYSAHHARGLTDERHARFVRNEAGDAACRRSLEAVQRATLMRRPAMLPFVQALEAEGFTFDVLGADRALEFAVLELPFRFWQFYGFAGTCADIPSPDVSDAELFGFVSYVSELAFAFSDQGLAESAPLYYQRATQLGGPRYPEAHLRSLLRYPGQDIATFFPPRGVLKFYEPWTMARVEHWVRYDAQRLLLIYGDQSPWSASAFAVSAANDSYQVIASDSIGFYGTLSALPEPQRGFLLGRLSEWAGVPVQPSAPGISARARAADPRLPRSR
ncbi:hypothetical protein ACLESD_37400 [Pyxidicoccus sp. 3LFB2]